MSKTVHHHHSTGIGIGAVAAALLSWTTWHSIPWAILHAFCGVFYVIYWMLVWW